MGLGTPFVKTYFGLFLQFAQITMMFPIEWGDTFTLVPAPTRGTDAPHLLQTPYPGAFPALVATAITSSLMVAHWRS